MKLKFSYLKIMKFNYNILLKIAFFYFVNLFFNERMFIERILDMNFKMKFKKKFFFHYRIIPLI